MKLPNWKGMSRGQKIAVVIGGMIVVYLIYRWQMSSTGTSTGQASSSDTGTGAATTGTSADQSAADYASLAAQEQSDVAALQGQNEQLAAQEQSDVSNLSSGMMAAGSSGVLSGGGGGIAGGGGITATSSPTGTTDTQGNIPSLATGSQPVNRARPPRYVPVASGSPFARYYKRVTGKNPPARVLASNFIYQAFRAGIRAQALNPPHPAAPQQTRVAHPNPNHHPTGGAGLPRSRPPPPRHRAAPVTKRR